MLTRLLTMACLLMVSVTHAADEKFEPLFNGQNLDGWVRVNTAPSTWSVKDGMLICTGKPIGELRTEKMYQNFILELEWRHMKPKGNAGVFVWADDITAKGVPFHRSIEVQVLENDYGNTQSYTTHGDIFPIHGATMEPINGRGGSRAFPTEFRSKPSPEWNHYRIECRDGNISLAVNGKVVTRGRNASPRKGYICLESEGGVVHYRDIKIHELPDTPIDEKHIAQANRGYRSLYTGLDLSGWNAEGDGWKSQDWILAHTGDQKGQLTTTENFGDLGFVFDVQLDKNGGPCSITVRGAKIPIDPEHPDLGKHLQGPGKWNRFEGELKGSQLTLTVNGQRVWTNQEMETAMTGPLQVKSKGPLRLETVGPVQFANIYVRKSNPRK